MRQCRLWANAPNANRLLLSPPHFSVGTSSIWTSVCVSECPKNTVFLRPLHCVFLRPSVLLRFFVPLWVVLSPPSSMCMLLFIIDQISLSPAQAKSLYGGVRWGLGTHLPQSCWDFFPLSTFPLDGVLESKTRVCSLDFAVTPQKLPPSKKILLVWCIIVKYY